MYYHVMASTHMHDGHVLTTTLSIMGWDEPEAALVLVSLVKPRLSKAWVLEAS